MIKMRYSTEADLSIIKELIENRFGFRESAYTDLDKRYLLMFKDGKLIGITGCNPSPSYRGYEIDWTCLLESEEGHGYITKMISEAIKGLDDKDIYCSCWHMPERDVVNLHHAMDALGFECCVPCRVRYCAEHFDCSDTCQRYKGKGCNCWEDLYIRRHK